MVERLDQRVLHSSQTHVGCSTSTITANISLNEAHKYSANAYMMYEKLDGDCMTSCGSFHQWSQTLQIFPASDNKLTSLVKSMICRATVQKVLLKSHTLPIHRF